MSRGGAGDIFSHRSCSRTSHLCQALGHLEKRLGQDLTRDALTHRGTTMTTGLTVSAILGLASTAFAFIYNRQFFVKGGAGRISPLEGFFYFVGIASLCLGWYFNVRYVHAYKQASYVNYTKMLFTNWAADSAAQDYTIVNVLLLPAWTIADGRRRRIRVPWIFFVMSLFTSLAFSMAMYLAFVERQVRFQREALASSTA